MFLGGETIERGLRALTVEAIPEDHESHPFLPARRSSCSTSAR